MKKILYLFLSFCLYTNFMHAEDNPAQQVSQVFTNISKKSTPAVVFIKAKYKQENLTREHNNPFNFFNDDFFNNFFGNHPNFTPQPKEAQGSGFIVSRDGYILTNYHVIKDCQEITVVMNNSKEYSAKIIGQDPRTDLAVIKIDAKNLPSLQFGNSDSLNVGEWVIAIGSPFELQSSVTVGVVSAKGRKNLRINDFEDFIQTDAAINPGNSGGPLLNLNGKVIGINTVIVTKTGGYMGIGFAIPSKMAENIFNQIIKTGSVTRGFLGITPQEVDDNLKEAFKLEKNKNGILIAEVSTNSAAEKSGLKEGDIIVKYDSKNVKDLNTFKNDIANFKPGTVVNFQILRNGQYQNIKVKLEKFIAKENVVSKAEKIGISVSEAKNLPQMRNTKEAIVVTKVKRGSIAQMAGFQPGMVILQINKKHIKTIQDFNNAMNSETKNLLFLVKDRHSIPRFISIKMS